MKLIDVTPDGSIVPVYVEELTELEQAKRDEDLLSLIAENLLSEAQAESKATARASALAKLAALGLTADEIAAL
jgi:hypothetical protein